MRSYVSEVPCSDPDSLFILHGETRTRTTTSYHIPPIIPTGAPHVDSNGM